MDAHGISNIGNMHVEIGVGETGPFIPGLTDLFVGKDYCLELLIYLDYSQLFLGFASLNTSI